MIPLITFPGATKDNEFDQVEIWVNGKKLKGWAGLNFKTEIDACAAGFSFDVPFDPDRQMPFKRFGYESVEIKYRGKTLTKGTAEVLSYGSAPENRSVNIQCRSKAARLLEDQIEPPFQFKAMTLQQIADQIAPGLVDVEDDSAPIPWSTAEAGQTQYEFLTKIASPRGLWAMPGLDGKLVFRKLPVSGKADLVIKPRKGPIGDISYGADGTQRYSKVIASGSGNGIGRKEEVSDPEISSEKRGVLYVKPEQQSADLRGAANKALRTTMIESESCSCNISGWEFNRTLFLAGILVEIEWPDAGIDIPRRFRVAQADLKIDDSSGKSGSLEFKPPEAYLEAGTD